MSWVAVDLIETLQIAASKNDRHQILLIDDLLAIHAETTAGSDWTEKMLIKATDP